MAESEEDDCGQGAAPPASLTPLPLLTPFSAAPLLHLVDSYSHYHIFYLPENIFSNRSLLLPFCKIIGFGRKCLLLKFWSWLPGLRPSGCQAHRHSSILELSYTLSRCPSTTFLFFEQLILQSDKSQTEWHGRLSHAAGASCPRSVISGIKGDTKRLSWDEICRAATPQRLPRRINKTAGREKVQASGAQCSAV